METEQQGQSKQSHGDIKRTTNIRRMIDLLVGRIEQLQNHPELLSLTEQEELEITSQKMGFLISNSFEGSVEDVSSSHMCEPGQMDQSMFYPSSPSYSPIQCESREIRVPDKNFTMLQIKSRE